MLVEQLDAEARPDSVARLRLRVLSEPDPGALVRILGRLQHLNLTPRQVTAEMSSTGRLYVQIDIVGLCEREVSLIASKIRQEPFVYDAHWHPIC
ncbi:MAG: hypothetical protein QOK23_1484 [Gammaproteobacteria bacterium]|jgi:hypothetical protein|nr:hypothetical protein [Gammaproteobacteria bacterium]MEA3139315.1 hypothetical protein [Gammaproteobacteria bacterium]